MDNLELYNEMKAEIKRLNDLVLSLSVKIDNLQTSRNKKKKIKSHKAYPGYKEIRISEGNVWAHE